MDDYLLGVEMNIADDLKCWREAAIPMRSWFTERGLPAAELGDDHPDGPRRLSPAMRAEYLHAREIHTAICRDAAKRQWFRRGLRKGAKHIQHYLGHVAAAARTLGQPQETMRKWLSSPPPHGGGRKTRRKKRRRRRKKKKHTTPRRKIRRRRTKRRRHVF